MATTRVQHQGPGVKMTEVEARMATSGLCFYPPSAIDRLQAVQI